MTMGQSLNYINAQFADSLHYGQLTVNSLRNQRIFELGFGDSVGVALKFLAVCGARQVVCLDKFYCKRDDKQQREIYQALRSTLKPDERERFDDVINLKNGLQLNPERLVCIYGSDVEDCRELEEGDSFDLIVSRSAMQYIYEPHAAFAAMDRMLNKSGLMLHKIDVSDQGMFRDNGLHPLTFLTISDRLYRMMALGSAKPNRKLLNYYRDQLEALGYDTTILITDLIGRKGLGDLHPHKANLETDDETTQKALTLLMEVRPHLLPRFRNLADLELIVCGIFVVARKPV
jgi:hypothetical protein